MSQPAGIAHSGKGSRPRPSSISRKEFGKKWDEIFSRKDKDFEKNTKRNNNSSNK